MILIQSLPDHPVPPGSDPVRRAVVVAMRRLRQRRALRFGATGFLAGSVIGFVIAVAISANLLPETTLPGGGAFLFLPTLVGLLAGGFYGAAGKYAPVSVARLLERRLDLKDRLSTALSTKRDGSAVIDALYQDAAAHAPSESDVFTAVPLTPVPRRVYVAGAVAAAVALAYFAPELPVFWSSTKRTEQVAVKKEGERLLAVAKAAAAEAKKQDLPEAEKAAKKVEKLGREMARGRMPLREALMERAKLGEELRKAQDKIAREQINRADQKKRADLNAAGRDVARKLQNSDATPSTNAPANTPDARMKSLQDALTRGDKSGVAQALREMADAAERGEPAPGAPRDKTGQQLAALGDALSKNNLPEAGDSAQKAGESMAKNAMPEAAQSLRDAADRIEQSGTAGSQDKQNRQNAGQQTQSGQSASGSGQGKDQNALQKMMDDIQKSTGEGTPQSGNSGSQQQGQSSQGNQPQGGSPQQGQGSQSQGGQSQSGQQGQSSPNQSGQPGQGNRPGQSGLPSNTAGQRGNQSSKSGSGTGPGNKAGQGSGGSAGPKGGKSGTGGGKGSGDGSTGNAKSGESTQRLSKGAKEQNVRGKQSGEGPETVVTENDTDRSALPASSLPYYKEYLKERGGPASESVQTRDAVPNAYRNQVRGYFDSLPPAPKPGAKGQ